MFWFFKSRAEERERIKMLESQVYVLEQTLGMIKMSLHNLQSALIAISKTQDTIGQDMANIGVVIANFVNVFEVDPFEQFGGSKNGRDDEPYN